MKLKSLLLGSAAALVVASGAQAADAIMAAQPEPVDYVRVCDAFGTGYFYIPGTETCLKIGGYVRQDIAGGDLLGNLNASGGVTPNNSPDEYDSWTGGHGWHSGTRFTLTTDTYSNTELGVLHTYTQTRFNYSNGGFSYDPSSTSANNNGMVDDGAGTSVDAHFAYIELGGFRVGVTESEYTALNFYGNTYAGNVINDTLIGYGPFAAQQISYTYKNPNGFSAFIGLEDDGNGYHDPAGTKVDHDDYIPDVLAGVSYNAGNWGAAIIGAYDSSMEEGAIKARVDAKFGRIAAFLMGAYSTNGSDTGMNNFCEGSITSCGSNHFATFGGDWALHAGLAASLTEKIDSNLVVGYDDSEDFSVAANLVFHVVPGFDVTTEIDYAKAGNSGINPAALVKHGAFDDSADAWGGIIRFQRSF